MNKSSDSLENSVRPAADRFLAGLNPEDILAFDQEVQKDTTRKFRGLAAVCVKPAEKGPAFRDRLLAGLRAGIDGLRVNGSLERRLPHNLHVSFEAVEGEALLMALGDVAVSTGSACSSGSQKPSHVLVAIGAVGENTGA